MEDKDYPEFISKSAAIEKHAVTDRDLELINQYALKELRAEDVFTFSVILCDNLLDRDYDRFTDKSLEDMRTLFLGRTVIKDHRRSADNQIARIFDTEIVTAGDYKQLRAKVYMVRTESNADLIREIEAGIKKEGSVGFSLEHYFCSICGTDNVTSWCSHWPGDTYKTDGGDKLCTFEMDGVKDAYEFSLVAVPAQRAAGACKCYKGALKPDKPAAEPDGKTESASAEEIKMRIIKTRIHNIKTRSENKHQEESNEQENA